LDQLGRDFAEALCLPLAVAVLHDEVLTLDIAQVA
jgi:hypothetical protein